MAEASRSVAWIPWLPVLLFGACSSGTSDQELLITLVADGSERAILLPAALTVDSLLRDVGIELGELDRLEPASGTLLRDGMRVTVVRVREEQTCERHVIPFQALGATGGPPNQAESHKVQTGMPGEEERCFLVRTEDGLRRDVMELDRVLIREPVEELWQANMQDVVVPLPIAGTLAWISNGDAWIVRHDSSRLQQLTHSGDLDGRVLSLSSDGRRLLFTRAAGNANQAPQRNQLWLLPDVTESSKALKLLPEEVSAATWLPGSAEEFGYSVAAVTGAFAHTRIDPGSGEVLDFREYLAPAGIDGIGLWETHFAWSPDGLLLAWARADAVGLINLVDEKQRILHKMSDVEVPGSVCSRPTLSWSPGSRLLMSMLPDAFAAESTVYVADVAGAYQIRLISQVGPCAAPTFAPVSSDAGFVFLRARNPVLPESRSGHDLILADRDGSNQRLLFPDAGQPGLQPQQVAWSPDAQQLAFVYQNQLWLLAIASGEARQLPFVGEAASPVWAG